jgi:penicillin-binding protein-related factor A (putative recombinase)
MSTIKVTEQSVVNACINYLNFTGSFVWRNNTGATTTSYFDSKGHYKTRFWRAGIKGSSDIIGIYKDGRFIAVECKAGKNKPTPEQTDFIDRIKTNGGIALIVYSLDELIEKLKK